MPWQWTDDSERGEQAGRVTVTQLRERDPRIRWETETAEGVELSHLQTQVQEVPFLKKRGHQ